MTQMTNAMSAVDALIEISTNGSVWTDISGFTNKLDVTPQSRASGEAYTFDGDTAIITHGKRQPVDITVNVLYSEGSANPFETVRAIHETTNGGTIYVRWSPGGGDSGDFRYTTPACKVTSFQAPQVDAGSPAPIPCVFVVRTPYYTKSVI